MSERADSDVREAGVSSRPSVLFVCVKNAGKSQMAAAIMRHLAGKEIEVHSAGTQPGESINTLSAAALGELDLEVEADMRSRTPRRVAADLVRRVDRTVLLGTEARLSPVAGMRGTIEVWETDEPSTRGVEGVERMRLIREDIKSRCQQLMLELQRPPRDHQSGDAGSDIDPSQVRAPLDQSRSLGHPTGVSMADMAGRTPGTTR